MRPIIGITADMSAGDKQHQLNHVYVNAVVKAGGIPVVLPAGEHICDSLDIIHGLLLSGGGDIDGKHFGQKNHREARDIRPMRDKAEIAITKLAHGRNMPILGICRGLQMLNVALGGDIVQHVEWHSQAAMRATPTHIVHTSGRLAGIIDSNSIMVNSIHHQVVGRAAGVLEVCGTAQDGVIEALCCKNADFVLGVQWHPEELVHIPQHMMIFKAFIESAAKSY